MGIYVIEIWEMKMMNEFLQCKKKLSTKWLNFTWIVPIFYLLCYLRVVWYGVCWCDRSDFVENGGLVWFVWFINKAFIIKCKQSTIYDPDWNENKSNSIQKKNVWLKLVNEILVQILNI